jgi:hypothetical protein
MAWLQNNAQFELGCFLFVVRRDATLQGRIGLGIQRRTDDVGT